MTHVETLPVSQSIDLAVFVVPPPGHPLCEQGQRLLGYDVWTGKLYPDEETQWPEFTTEDVRRVRQLPKPYGVHITIGDAFEYSGRALLEVARRLENIVKQLPAFTLRGASYDRQFPDSGLVLIWEEGIDHLQRLAVTVAVHINTLRQRHPRVTVPMTTQPQLLRDWAAETVFGRFWTIDKYYPHLTLANSLHNRLERDRLWAAWQQTGVMGNVSSYNLNVDRVYLMTRHANSDFWVVHPNFPEGFLFRGSHGRTTQIKQTPPIRGTAPLRRRPG